MLRQDQKTQKLTYPLIAVAAAVVILAIVVFFGYRGLTPHASPTTTVSAQQAASDQWLMGKAKESKGDFNSLSPADQQKVQEITHGSGSFAINVLYKK